MQARFPAIIHRGGSSLKGKFPVVIREKDTKFLLITEKFPLQRTSPPKFSEICRAFG